LSSPVSIQDGLSTTNALASKKFLIVHILIIWGSLLPILIETFIFWNILKTNNSLFFVLFPFQVCLGYFTLILSSTLISKFTLALSKLIHTPKQGVFKLEKRNKDYYFWSLRATIKKWPIWLGNLIPSSIIHNFILKLFGLKTDYSNNISKGNIDTEFVELGSNINIGQGCSIRSSMIIKGHLIINKITIGDNVKIGSNSFIAPGTLIGPNTILGTMSVTKKNQKLEPNMIYVGNPVEKIQFSILDQIKILKTIEIQNQSSKIDNKDPLNSEDKFIKNLSLNILSFGIIYFFSNLLPIVGFFYYFQEYILPFFLQQPTIIHICKDIRAMLVFLLTPLILIILLIVNLFTVILIIRIVYKISQYNNHAKEGIFHWTDQSNDFKNYFKRSFFLRYVKWKIQKSPFPWLIKPAFNFIGNCQFGKGTIIENCYIAKEFLKVGQNSYLGKSLLANHLWDKNLTIKRILIGNNVEISDNCCIAPGTDIANNVSILPLSVTSKYEKISGDSTNSYINNIGDDFE
jgi:acetyltransferase-like isoleucine patch superfamily enzyme